VTQPRVADDFGTIRARIEELRRERAASAEGAEQSDTPQPKGMSATAAFATSKDDE